jgi:hypothetical protein
MAQTKASKARQAQRMRDKVRAEMLTHIEHPFSQVQRVGRIRKAIARNPALETKIIGTESAETQAEKIRAVQRLALAVAQQDSARIVSTDSPLVYQIVQKMHTLRKNEGFAVEMKYVANKGDFFAEYRYAVAHRFRAKQHSATLKNGKLEVYRNF